VFNEMKELEMTKFFGNISIQYKKSWFLDFAQFLGLLVYIQYLYIYRYFI
jgi:hypothetical protein